MLFDIEAAGRIINSLNNTAFACPFCGHEYDAAECEVAQAVVSFWGEDDHAFACDECGEDFVVRETVMRSFSAGKTTADLDHS